VAIDRQPVASKVAVEIAVCLEQRHGNALAGQEQGKYRAAWPAADDAAVRVLDRRGVVDIGSCLRVNGRVAHLRPPWTGVAVQNRSSTATCHPGKWANAPRTSDCPERRVAPGFPVDRA
jgi:hypothetical protein